MKIDRLLELIERLEEAVLERERVTGQSGLSTVDMKVEKKDHVAVAVVVGYERTDGTGPLVDVEAVLLAWADRVREKPKAKLSNKKRG